MNISNGPMPSIVEQCEWIVENVPNGAIIYVDGECVAQQKSVWIVHSDRFGYIEGHFN